MPLSTSRNPAQIAVTLGFSLVSGLAFSQEEIGTSEIIDIATKPAVVTAGQDFELILSGYHLGEAELWDEPVLEGNTLRVVGVFNPNCFSVPYPPLSPNDRPWITRLPIAGLEAGTYRVEASWRGHDCNAPLPVTSLESSITVFPQSLDLRAWHESPGEGDVVSGVGVIRGWACYPSINGEIGKVTFTVDEYPVHFPLPHGSDRPDTASVCDQNTGAHSEGGPVYSGYGGVVYWPSLLNAGEHTLRVYVDGDQIDEVEITVVTPPPTEVPQDYGFRKGAQGEYIIDAFLGTEESVKVRWSEADQNFIIVEYN